MIRQLKSSQKFYLRDYSSDGNHVISYIGLGATYRQMALLSVSIIILPTKSVAIGRHNWD